MANMTKNTTTGNYELSVTPSTSAITETLNVNGKYCNANIVVTINAIPSYKEVEVTASSSQIYKVIGSVILLPIVSGAFLDAPTISNTYFKITSISATSITYQIMKQATSSSTPDWDSYTISFTSGNATKCILQYNPGETILAKCSSTATSQSVPSFSISATSGTTTYQGVYNFDCKGDLYWFQLRVYIDSLEQYKCIFYKYMGPMYSRNYKPSNSYGRSSESIYYKYSSNGTSWTEETCSKTASSSGSYTGTSYVTAYYYPTSEYL